MKFSQKKKNKIRKINQRRIDKTCKNMIGCRIYPGFENYKNCYEVEDQAKIRGVMYLLVRSENKQYAIYRITKPREYVRLSPKRILQNQKCFSNHVYWKKHSTIQMNSNGEIESVKLGTIWGPYNAQRFPLKDPIVIFVEIG